MRKALGHQYYAGGIAALVNAGCAIATFVMLFGFIGTDVLNDRSALTQFALYHPTPLLIQDSLTFVSATAACFHVVLFARLLWRTSPTLICITTLFGLLAIALLMLNAGYSVYATLQLIAAPHNQGSIGVQRANMIDGGMLALLATMVHGIWYLGVHWLALRAQTLLPEICQLGVVIGCVSLLAPFGLAAAVLSTLWSAWLGLLLLHHTSMELPTIE